MTRIAWKTLWAHKRRLLGTSLAVLLGVAFLSGTLVLSDTLRANFDDLFARANAGTDAVVRSATAISGEDGTRRGPVDRALIDEIRAVDGVAAAVGIIEGYGQLRGKDGDALGGNGPPVLAGNWIAEAELNPYRIAEGRAPERDDEVVINVGAADAGDLALGDTTILQTPEPVEVTIVGLATFGDADGLGPVTFTGLTDAAAARHIAKAEGRVDRIAVAAADGVTESALADRIRRVAPRGLETLTGTELTRQDRSELDADFLDLLRAFLLVFSGIALLVATFSIYNTFSVIVAQRTRESALLRALGASRRQVLTSVVVEALAVGVVASVGGLLGGIAVASLLKGMFAAFGSPLPTGGLVFSGTTVLVSIVVGVVVSLLAGVGPALRASKVLPLAALREVALDRSAASVRRAVAGLVLTGAGVAAVLAAVLGGGDNSLGLAGAGAVATLSGVVVFGPVVARPASGVIGAPLVRLRGVTGSLARRNAMRNPRRTSGTAAALMVGVGVVTLFTVFGASLKATIDEAVSESFAGDLVLTSGAWGGGGFGPALAAEIDALPEVDAAAGIGRGSIVVDGDDRTVTVADLARVADLVDLEMSDGSADLGPKEIGVSDGTAESHRWTVGSAVPVTFADGTTTPFTVGATFAATDIAGNFVLPRAAWAAHTAQVIDNTVLIGLIAGVGIEDGRAAVQTVADRYGAPDVQDRAEYTESVAGGVNMMLSVVYVMLALAVLIALMGIANTLSLSIHERTRELGLLRAVGETRAQVRSMVRWESVIIALFGTVGGIGVGVFLGWALVQSASEETIGTFAAPVGQLAVVLALGAVAGILAGIRPARRAARLKVLDAIAATE